MCPNQDIEQTYYFRWWTFRKHIKRTPAGTIVTEFLTPVSHAGSYNSISCAAGHHLMEGRWIRDQKILDEYTRFWFRADNGSPEPRFHRYSQWLADAMFERYLVTGRIELIMDLFNDLVADYETWEREKLRPDGLFWQHDVWDGMEESISGSRTAKNARPTINSYMFANAQVIMWVAALMGKHELAVRYRDKSVGLRKRVQEVLWDQDDRFFKAQTNENGLCDAREAIGFIPWCFNLPDPGREDAFKQLIDPEGFAAPFGFTTAERRHRLFRSHGSGNCEWDGAVWPFATSQILVALANVLRHYDQSSVNSGHFFDAMQVYARSHQMNGKPYIGEYLDETTGQWLKGDHPRSRYYNHSCFCDHVINGLVGLTPRADETIAISPLVPEDRWDWFCLDGVAYHGRDLTIVWDRDGKKFATQPGLSVFIDGKRIAHSQSLAHITGEIG
jgi:hypothetical protein